MTYYHIDVYLYSPNSFWLYGFWRSSGVVKPYSASDPLLLTKKWASRWEHVDFCRNSDALLAERRPLTRETAATGTFIPHTEVGCRDSAGLQGRKLSASCCQLPFWKKELPAGDVWDLQNKWCSPCRADVPYPTGLSHSNIYFANVHTLNIICTFLWSICVKLYKIVNITVVWDVKGNRHLVFWNDLWTRSHVPSGKIIFT